VGRDRGRVGAANNRDAEERVGHRKLLDAQCSIQTQQLQLPDALSKNKAEQIPSWKFYMSFVTQ